MLNILIQIILAAIAGFTKAVADTIIHHDNGKLPNKPFWDNISNEWRIPFTKYPMDAKHISNSLMIIALISIVRFGTWAAWWVQIGLLGAVFILVFNLFWNKILNDKPIKIMKDKTKEPFEKRSARSTRWFLAMIPFAVGAFVSFMNIIDWGGDWWYHHKFISFSIFFSCLLVFGWMFIKYKKNSPSSD